METCGTDDLTEVRAAGFGASVRLPAAVSGIGLMEEEEEEEEKEEEERRLALVLVLLLVDEEPAAAGAIVLSEEVTWQAEGFGWISGADGPPFSRTLLLAVPEASMRGAAVPEEEEEEEGSTVGVRR